MSETGRLGGGEGRRTIAEGHFDCALRAVVMRAWVGPETAAATETVRRVALQNR